MDAVTKVQAFLQENDIIIQLGKPQVRFLEDGSFLVEKAPLQIFYAHPPKQPETKETTQPETEGKEATNESEQPEQTA